MSERWLRRRLARESASHRTVCFPHAGGAASFFAPWATAAPPQTEIWAVQYPGREDRLTERCVGDMDTLAAAVARHLVPLADRPLVLFGHSLGALVAYETARTLHREYGVAPAHLVVSGRRAPTEPAAGDIHLRPDEEVVAELVRLGGTDRRLLRDPDVRAVFLPAIRSDFRLAETYRHRAGTLLTCPITAVIGTEDTEVDTERALGWRHTTTGTFALRRLPGGHFYLIPQRSAVLGLLAPEAADAIRP
ncbi:alpha/beta fold hydrolase [Thermopolyspora sp. NPDC052614]|uniref:thioesterase II family protein n=1 Tax=Thermopolyspora sp. NPDC052614 TaxID=3155682 RepID=UPI003432F557